MTLTKFAFIVKGPGYRPDEHRSVLDSGLFQSTIVGVSTLQQAEEIALELRASGLQLLELCGGFSVADAEFVQSLLDPEIPVGVVQYSAAQERKLTELFNGLQITR